MLYTSRITRGKVIMIKPMVSLKRRDPLGFIVVLPAYFFMLVYVYKSLYLNMQEKEEGVGDLSSNSYILPIICSF
ncbi:hypothetical protein GCM10008013_02210 [Paenibacillus segetis]|uniref:ABC-2 type transport system permease protein n=1 Tax=Paenibacillus segetis TaxID=1325360 RepID=A0ABQ1Y3W4_9BACL|nr:hypothetical protein GCM10008013_02210 [Paenibacillus segetis]